MSNLTNPFENLESLKKHDLSDEMKFKNLYQEILEMEISTNEQFQKFQAQRDLLEMHFVNEFAESYFLHTLDVSDEKRKKRKDFCEQVLRPITREYEEKLGKKYLESEVGKKQSGPFHILRRNQLAAIELYRPENQELLKQMDQISAEITEIQGKLLANWKGEMLPIPAVRPFLESQDREERKNAYEAILEANLSVSDRIDALFDQLIVLRNKVAHQAGFQSYTPYRFKELQRFDWSESDCLKFHAAVKKHIVPVKEKLLQKRKKALNLDAVKPYDLEVDIDGKDPLKLYEKGHSHLLIEGAGKIVKAIDNELYSYFCEIRDNNLLDLETRKNKAPGGYMVMYPVYEKASVFYNGTGLAEDLMVVLHELGHCFHYFLGKDVRPYSLQNWTSEVAEAGSMSMEYMGLEKMQEYLDADSCKRLKEDRLRRTVDLFISCAMGDEFQHWLYANPKHSSLERKEKWLELYRVYRPGIDNKGYQDQQASTQWQFQHILNLPFYLIDYSISELLALSIWDRYKNNPADGIAHYKAGCSVAATKTVPDIYKLFGTKLSFDEDVISPLAKRLEQELDLN